MHFSFFIRLDMEVEGLRVGSMFFHIGKDELLSRWVGESEDQPTDVFRLAIPDVLISSTNFIDGLCSINSLEGKLFIKSR